MNPLQRSLTGLVFAVIAACGGNNTQIADGGIGGTGITMGRITGFGSVFVNGIEFDTSSSQFIIEEASGFDENALQLGMVVRVSGDYQDATGTAISIEYRNELQGVVTRNGLDANGIGTMNVLGQVLHVNTATIFDNDSSAGLLITQLSANDVIEASGFSDGTGEIHATRIELKSRNWTSGSASLEIKGLAANLTASTFDIGGLRVDYSLASTLPAVNLQGLYVKVTGTQYDPLTQTLLANSVELIGDGLLQVAQDTENVELEGVVTTAFDGLTGQFQLNGQLVRVSENTQYSGGTSGNIQLGRELDVEGVMNASLLEASEVNFSIAQEQLQEMAGAVEESPDLSTGSLKLLGQRVFVNSSTIMQDEENQERFFDLSLIQPSDYIEADVYYAEQALVAAKLNRDSGTKAEVEGFVQAVNVDGDSRLIRILDIKIDIGTATTPNVGDRLEVEGIYADGILKASTVEDEDEDEDDND